MAKVSDEVIIAALLSEATNKAAAEKVGITVRHLYQRTSDSRFQQKYRKALDSVLQDASDLIRRNVCKAVETAASIMENEEVAPQIRLNACELLLRNMPKLKASATEEAWENALGGPPLWR